MMQVALQQRFGGHGFVAHAAQCQRDERDDDERVEDDGRKDGRLRRLEVHDVERTEDGEGRGEHRGDDGEVLGDVVGDGEGGERAACHEKLLADLDDLDELGRVGVEVDHVAGLFGGLCAGVHGDAYVGLGERGGVVRAVAGHRDKLALGLLALDEVHLVLGLGLGEEVVDAGLAGDGGGSEGVVAGDHDGLDAHGTELVEALFHAALDDVFEVDDAEGLAVFGDDERGASVAGDALDSGADLVGELAAVFVEEAGDGVG